MEELSVNAEHVGHVENTNMTTIKKVSQSMPEEILIPIKTQGTMKPLIDKMTIIQQSITNLSQVVIDCKLAELDIENQGECRYENNPEFTKLILKKKE